MSLAFWFKILKNNSNIYILKQVFEDAALEDGEDTTGRPEVGAQDQAGPDEDAALSFLIKDLKNKNIKQQQQKRL